MDLNTYLFSRYFRETVHTLNKGEFRYVENWYILNFATHLHPVLAFQNSVTQSHCVYLVQVMDALQMDEGFKGKKCQCDNRLWSGFLTSGSTLYFLVDL